MNNEESSHAPVEDARSTRQAAAGLTRRGLLFGALIAPGVLGVTAAVIALPALARDLSWTTSTVSWLLTGYALTQALGVAVFGRVADVWGIRTVLATGAVLITAGSALAVVGGSFVVLLLGRLLQGAGAGSLQLIAFATVGHLYAGADRAKVLGVVVAFIGVVSGTGSLIGGALTEIATWRGVFAVPAVSLLAMAGIARLTPAARPDGTRLDAFGATLVAVAAAALLLLLELPSLGLPAWLAAILVAAAAAAATVSGWRVRRVPHGFIPAAVAGSRRYVASSLTALGIGAGYLGILFAAPLLLGGRGWGPLQIGLILLPGGIIAAASARLAGRLVATRDPFRVTAVFAAASTGGLLLAGLAGHAAAWAVVLGFGLGMSGFTAGEVALLDAASHFVPRPVRSAATGLLILMFLLGGAIGPALVAGLTNPLGLHTAVAILAVLPAAGALLALSARTARTAAGNQPAS